MLFTPADPTPAHFVEFFAEDPPGSRAFWVSLLIGVASATVATLVAWPVAFAIWRSSDRWSQALAGVVSLPFVLPPSVLGVGLGFFRGIAGGLGSLWAGVLSHASLFAALPLATVLIKLRSIDRAHLDATTTMGRRGRRAAPDHHPQTTPHTLSGIFFILVHKFNEFIMIYFVSASRFSTVTSQIFNSIRNDFTPTMSVAAILFITISAATFALVGRYGDLPHLLGADPSRRS